MTIQTLGGGVLWPNRGTATSTAAFTNDSGATINASSEKVGIIFQAASTEPISGGWFRTATVTVGATLSVRLETVSSSDGLPSGTLASTSASGTVTISSTEDNVAKDFTFTGTHTPNKGDWLALLWCNPATSSESGSLAPVASLTDGPEEEIDVPYWVSYDGGTWSKLQHANAKCIAVNHNGTYYYLPGLTPVSAANTHTFNNTSSTDVYGAKFYLPMPARVSSWWGFQDLDGDAKVKLYNSDGATVLGTISLNQVLEGTTDPSYQEGIFPTAISLTKDTTYRIGLEADSTVNLSCYSFDVSSSGLLGGLSGGQNFIFTSAKDPAGTTYWTDNPTRVPFMGLRFNGFDDGGSTGGTSGIGVLTGGGLAR